MASRSHCYIVFIYLLFLYNFAQFTRARFAYDRQVLLDINNRCTNIVLDHPFDGYRNQTSYRPEVSYYVIPTGSVWCRHRDSKQKRGKRGGFQAKLRLNPHQPAMPSIFLAYVQSLVIKADKLNILTQQRFMDCNLMVFTKTWLNNDVPNSVVDSEGNTVFRAERDVATSGKSKNVSCITRGQKTLDHVYTNMANAYNVTPFLHLGQSDHLS